MAGSRRRTVSYALKAVDLPPRPTRTPSTRISALQRQVLIAAENPGRWFLIAEYGTRTGAYQGKKRVDQRSWPWPVVTYAVPITGGGSELYVKVMEVKKDG